jgi:hypothetical protein
MSEASRFGRLKAVIKNAVVWGAGWGTLGTVVASLMRLSDGISLPFALLDGLGMGIRIGFMGGLAGALFAAFISIAYRGKRLSEISWLRFGAGGLVFAGVFVPVFMETMNLLTGGGGVPLNLITDDIIMSALFGGITAAGTMKLAQHGADEAPVTVDELLDRMEQQSLGSGEATGIPARQGSRVTERS